MTARILVVDDLDINLRLLEARLSAEYFEVLVARSGVQALEICEAQAIDLVLLDVMMPQMDGYEVCRRLKTGTRTRHLPVVLITALDQPSDRLRGLEAGADDFLTKPVRDLPLFSRVKSLTRLKLLTDELRVRAETTINIVSRMDLLDQLATDGKSGRLVLIDDDKASADKICRLMRPEHQVDVVDPLGDFIEASLGAEADLLMISLSIRSCDPLRLCSQIRSREALRQVPLLMIAEANDEQRTAKALELGANDYLVRPIDGNELLARVRTQIKRKRYDEMLRQSVRETIELAVTDALTGLHNRRFLEMHLSRAIEQARLESKPLSLLIADIDHFKRINDGWGHDVGDGVLRQFAARVRESIRGSDLACRFGGEEFVVMMPDCDERSALTIAERLRRTVADAPFDIGGEALDVTVSVGFAALQAEPDDMNTLLKRADRGLYEAKRKGRNQVVALAA